MRNDKENLKEFDFVVAVWFLKSIFLTNMLWLEKIDFMAGRGSIFGLWLQLNEAYILFIYF